MTDLATAEAEVQAARARLFGTFGEVQERLSPSHIAHNAMESATHHVASVARKGADTVRNRPVATAAAAGAIGLFLARGWIADIFRKRRHHETEHGAKGLKRESRSAKRAKKGS